MSAASGFDARRHFKTSQTTAAWTFVLASIWLLLAIAKLVPHGTPAAFVLFPIVMWNQLVVIAGIGGGTLIPKERLSRAVSQRLLPVGLRVKHHEIQIDHWRSVQVERWAEIRMRVITSGTCQLRQLQAGFYKKRVAA